MLGAILFKYGYYGFLAIGALSMNMLTFWRRELYGFSVFRAILFPLLLLICGVSGTKLLFYIESGFTSFDGMSFFGAVYLVMLVMPVIGLVFRLKPMQTLDACAPCVASIIGFMRFGCLCAGCCGGVMCTIGAFSFQWPAQLLEGFGDIMILAFLLHLEQKKDKQGILYPVFLLSYGIMRFFVEFIRITPKNILGLSEGQWLSILATLIGMTAVMCFRKGKRYVRST